MLWVHHVTCSRRLVSILIKLLHPLHIQNVIASSCFSPFPLFSQMQFLSVPIRSYCKPASILLAIPGGKGGASRVHFATPLRQPVIRDTAPREATQSDNRAGIARCLIGRCCEVSLHRTFLNVRGRWVLIGMDLATTAVQ